ncbi:MAG: nitrous oxide reductase accessory protein NosL [bacterium]
MIRKNSLCLVGSLIALGVLVVFFYPGIRSTDGSCKLCAEEIHEGMRYTVTLSDGVKIKACCPTCGLHLQVHDAGKVASADATDYATGKTVVAAQAFYVEGSDVHHCDPQRMMRNETGGIYAMDWHRCDPSLVAFGSRQAAAAFQIQHGGRIMSFDEVKETVKTH